MNSVEFVLVEVVHIAEAPLYSAYRWLGRQVGRDLPLSEFLRLVDELIRRDVLRLWEVDQSHDRSELYGVPEGLEQRYRSADALDAGFDPFGLSLTLGAAAEAGASPEWEVDFDFDGGRFQVVAEPGRDADALRQAASYFPDVELVPRERTSTDGRVRITGHIAVR